MNSSERSYTFRGHLIHLQKEVGKNWYIIVTAPDGCYAYDGWWADSEDSTLREALAEAKRGACIGKAN